MWDGHSHPETFAAALVHGHDHPEGTPPHTHDLTPAPSARQDPPRSVQSPAFSPLRLGPPAQLALATAPLRGRPPAGPSGCGPPRLALLCSLLI